MAKLSPQQVKHVARLAHLSFKPTQITKFSSQLVKILDYMDQIGALNTTRTAETSQVIGLTNRTRKDEITPETILSQDQALSNAKRTYNGYFVVDAIFEK